MAWSNKILRKGSDTSIFEGIGREVHDQSTPSFTPRHQKRHKYKDYIPLIEQISDTRSQGCTDLQRLVTCLDHVGIVVQNAVMQGCFRLCVALNSILEAIFSHGK